MSIPYIDKALLEHLQKTFPNKLPEQFTTPEDIGYLIGQQKVLTYLQHHFNLQVGKLLTGKT